MLGIGSYVLSVEKIREMLNIDKSMYSNYGSFKQRVLESSIKEINKCSTLVVVFSEIKKGKRVVEIKFKIREKVEIPVNDMELLYSGINV